MYSSNFVTAFLRHVSSEPVQRPRHWSRTWPSTKAVSPVFLTLDRARFLGFPSFSREPETFSSGSQGPGRGFAPGPGGGEGFIGSLGKLEHQKTGETGLVLG